MVYLVGSLLTTPQTNEKIDYESNIEKKIEKLAFPFRREGNLFFVSFGGTTSALTNLLGFGDELELGFGVIIPITNHAGYALKDLWEWIKIYNE